MIRCLDAYDLGYKGSVILVHELDEFVLRRSGPDNEDRVHPIESSRDLVKEMPWIIRVLSRLPTAFRMAVNVVLRREDCGLVCRLRMDVKDPRFLVVYPDDGVRHDLILSAKPTVELKDGRCYRVGVFGAAATSSL
jgi:hypothetical protein